MYQKTNWVNRTPTNSGTPINANNLNKIENALVDLYENKGGGLFYSIAAPNSLHKERADLDLTGVADPAQAIMDAIAALDSQRESDDVAIVVEFMGGVIDLGDKQIIIEHNNICLYGNGVKIISNHADQAISISKNDIHFYNFIIDSANIALNIHGTRCKVVGNSCISLYANGCHNNGSNCVMIGNAFRGTEDTGLYNNGANSIIIGNTCSCGLYSAGLHNSEYATGCVIIGNDCAVFGINVYEDTTHPNSAELLSQMNIVDIGDVTVIGG